MLDKTVAVLLAGGVGSRLHPLTEERAKPAVPFGGKYRIIDFRRDKDGVPARVAFLEYDPNRSAHIARLHYLDGENNRHCYRPEIVPSHARGKEARASRGLPRHLRRQNSTRATRHANG